MMTTHTSVSAQQNVGWGVDMVAAICILVVTIIAIIVVATKYKDFH